MPAVALDLVPVRALNQVTYCPRLYYLQYVDCVMPTNEHVEAGLHDHRRVDDPDLAHRTRKDGDAHKTRGVALSSAALGLTGVLDVIEERDGEPVPVETKHGAAPRDDAGRATTWDNDAVQLCGQALLMEEAFGKPVERGVQFYNGPRSGSKYGSPTSCAGRRGARWSCAGSCPPATPRRTRCRPSCGTAALAARSPRSACRRRRSIRSATPPRMRPTSRPPA